MLVRDVMTSPVVTVGEDAPVQRVARLMTEDQLGCIIVTGKDGKPLGIITERDLVARVLAKDAPPGSLTARDVMSSPLITVGPDETLSGAARRMSRLNIRRLGVLYKGKLVGIVTSRDITAMTPELIAIIQERARIEGAAMDEVPEEPPRAGYCDQCSRWSDDLKEVEGNFLCEECRADLETEEAEY